MYKMLDATIDLGSLCVIVVVVVCSWGVALLCSLSCWNSYKKSQPSHLYCTQCSTLAVPPLPVTIPVTIPPLQYYHPTHQQQMNPHQVLPHTAERLGIIDPGVQHTAVPVSHLGHMGQDSHPALPRAACGAGVEVLETIPVPSPAREDDLDQDTTISRSFRSAKKRSLSNRMSPPKTGGSNASMSNLMKPTLTLSERFGILSNPIIGPEDGNGTAKSTASVQSKLSQVRIISSPPPNEEDLSQAMLTRTPSNAMRSTRKSLSKSVKSFLGSKSNRIRTSSRVVTSSGVDRGESVITKVPTTEIRQEVITSETNVENSDEDNVFINENPRTAHQLGHHYVTPVNAELVPRQLSQEQLLAGNPQFGRRRSGAGSDWTNPRKERKVGSPGNTATADYFIKQQTPQVQVVDIDLEEPGKDKAMTKF